LQLSALRPRRLPPSSGPYVSRTLRLDLAARQSSPRYQEHGDDLVCGELLQEGAVEFRSWYAEWGAAIILIKGLTPIPFKLVTIASGLAAFNFPLFVLTALITRGARFFLIAALLKRYGAPIQDFIERRLNLIGIAFLAALAAGFGVIAFI
jgi:hypothetical protein